MRDALAIGLGLPDQRLETRKVRHPVFKGLPIDSVILGGAIRDPRHQSAP
jgi:hypothetical protein